MDINVSKLKELGLSEYEIQAYLCLLQKEQLTATEISKITNIPRTKIYSTINKLEKKNFCSRVPGYKGIYRVNNPKDPISKHLMAYENHIKSLTSLSELLSEYYQKTKNNNDLVDYIEIIKDSELILERVNQIEKEAKHNVKSMLKSPFIMSKEKIIHENYNPHEKSLDYTYLYDSRVLEDNQMVKVLQFFQSSGVNIRICDNVPVKMAIFDDKTVLINLKDKVSTKTSFTTMFVHHEDFAKAFIDIFTSYYERSVDLTEKIASLGYEGQQIPVERKIKHVKDVMQKENMAQL
jgi:HTH-type transcriptional regulator, sugar sensing transcriptional regulator